MIHRILTFQADPSNNLDPLEANKSLENIQLMSECNALQNQELTRPQAGEDGIEK